MQRYDLEAVNHYGFCPDYEMHEDKGGEWVKHDDAAARIAELEADRDRLAAIFERARNGDHAGGIATIWSLREQRDNGLVRIAELESEFGAARDKYVREGIERVMEASRSREGVPDDIVQRTCDDALAEFKKEQQR